MSIFNGGGGKDFSSIIGTGTLNTPSQTLIGAINELYNNSPNFQDNMIQITNGITFTESSTSSTYSLSFNASSNYSDFIIMPSDLDSETGYWNRTTIGLVYINNEAHWLWDVSEGCYYYDYTDATKTYSGGKIKVSWSEEPYYFSESSKYNVYIPSTKKIFSDVVSIKNSTTNKVSFITPRMPKFSLILIKAEYYNASFTPHFALGMWNSSGEFISGGAYCNERGTNANLAIRKVNGYNFNWVNGTLSFSLNQNFYYVDDRHNTTVTLVMI